MIRHIVLFRLNDEYTGSAREQILQLIKIQAGELPESIAEIKNYQFGADVLRGDRSFDFGMIMDFESLSDLHVYTNHPAHQAFVTFIKNHRKERISLDFEC